jgi:hypothetical protein
MKSNSTAEGAGGDPLAAQAKALQSKFGFDPASILTIAREMLSSS